MVRSVSSALYTSLSCLVLGSGSLAVLGAVPRRSRMTRTQDAATCKGLQAFTTAKSPWAPQHCQSFDFDRTAQTGETRSGTHRTKSRTSATARPHPSPHRTSHRRRAMSYWSVTIPTQTAQGSSGVHVFIVVAEGSDQARGHALARASMPTSRRHRRDAALRLDALTVAEITTEWGM